ncbi:hypothetical protein CYMTET_9410 [Cymbomonas tetramitiformis]|uniref:Uncharacterized protein n=1 Tax=Cymbomonas tetramitiformis TaxID=36881 RepID=A0AAE0LFI3_9CHLO|nr:hypothetical protein CYMTET_9410 [Cymbomonas tetramitiformis]
MVHFGSTTPAVIDQPAVEHEPKVAIESDDDSALYPQQFIDGEPPFEQSFMDNMSVQLSFNETEQQVSANSFTPLLPWIPSTHESASLADSESESVSGDEDVHDDVPPPARSTEIAPRSVVYGQHFVHQKGTVDLFIDTAFLDSGAATDFANIFDLDPGVIYSDTAKISRRADSVDN